MRVTTTLCPLPLSIALLFGLWAQASCADWRGEIAGATQVGQGQFSWFGFVVYEAHLWSAARTPDWEHAFALELVYRRDLSRDTLVQASLDEMRRLGSDDEALLAAWAGEMRQAFVDVKAGQRITGVYLPGEGCRFYVDDKPRHEVADTRFARAFFSIWLDPRTRNPELRRDLLGLNGEPQ
jgi:hypothetical protein